MGYDKPDLGFVVHFQAPSSAIAYYQQVGRAGRGVEEAHVVLLRGARGPRDPGLLHRHRVPRAGRSSTACSASLAADGRDDAPGAAGRRQPRPRPARGDAEGARRRGRRAARGLGLARDRRAVDLRRRALRARSPRCAATSRRRCAPTARTGAASCSRCRPSSTTPRPSRAAGARCARARASRAPLDEALVQRAGRALRSRPVVLSVRRQTPRTADGPGKRLGPELQLEEGRALGRAGDGGLGPARARRAAPPGASTTSSSTAWPRRCAAGRRRRRRAGSRRCRRGAPARSSPTSRPGSPAALGLPCVELLERTGDNPPPARDGQLGPAGRQRPRAVPRAAAPPEGPGLLVDDLRLLRVDARDGRRAAAPGRRRPAAPAGPRRSPAPEPVRRQPPATSRRRNDSAASARHGSA